MTITQTTPIDRDPQRLQEILPWYLNGTLAEADVAWVERTLDAADSADLRSQLELDRQVAAVFEQKVAEVPADIGWARLMQQVRADAAPPLAVQGLRGRDGSGAGSRGLALGGASGESWMQRLSRLLAPAMSPRLGLALAVVVAAQTLAIGVLLSGREYGGSDTVEYRSADGARPVAAIRALLNETITEKALREALSANSASIVDGPNGLGEYWIVTGNGDAEAVAASLRQAGVIASYVIDHRPRGR
jgi:hypothetical protein